MRAAAVLEATEIEANLRWRCNFVVQAELGSYWVVCEGVGDGGVGGLGCFKRACLTTVWRQKMKGKVGAAEHGQGGAVEGGGLRGRGAHKPQWCSRAR